MPTKKDTSTIDVPAETPALSFVPAEIPGPRRTAKPNEFADQVRALADSDKCNTQQGVVFETTEKFSRIRGRIQRAAADVDVTAYVVQITEPESDGATYQVGFRVADKVTKGTPSA